MSDWARRKEDWLRLVAAEIHEWLPLAVAVELAAYFNSRSHDAWPSADTVAAQLGTDRRNVQRAIKKLAEAGLLTLRRAGQLRRCAMAGLESVPKDAEERTKRSEERTRRSGGSVPDDTGARTVGRHNLRKNLRKGNLRESARTSRASPSLSDPPSTQFPEDWVLGDPEIAAAQQICPDWAVPECEEQFTRFRRWCLSHGRSYSNWVAAWQTWCQRGREHQAKEEKQGQGRRRRTSTDDALEGLQEFLQRPRNTLKEEVS
jgi:DNA-binding transcriptional ArsR family regulator